MSIVQRPYRYDCLNPSFLRDDGTPLSNTGDWQGRHLAALTSPRGFEIAIVGLLKAWAEYADSHAMRYESGIGDDGVLGDCWLDIAKGIRGLLDGDCGRLDCGTLDGFISATLRAESFNPDTMKKETAHV